MNIEDLRTDLLYDPVALFWLDVRDNIARIGMSPLVQESTGAFVAVQFAAAGTQVFKGESFGSTEAEKHVGQLKSPVSGELLCVNEAVLENPRLLNTDPYGQGWLVEIALSYPETELPLLVQSGADVQAFFEAEIKRYEDKGWLAEEA